MKSFLAVGIGGFLGAVSRYNLSLLFPNTGGFPVTTLCINILGCFFLAWLFTAFPKRSPIVLGIGTGFFWSLYNLFDIFLGDPITSTRSSMDASPTLLSHKCCWWINLCMART